MTNAVVTAMPEPHHDPHHQAPGRRISLLSLLADYAIIWLVLGLFIGLAITTPNFLTGPNMRNILDQQSLVLIAASLATITLIAGGFDISQGAVYVAAPLVALSVENQTGSVVLAVIAGCGFGLVAGAVNGGVVTLGKINSFIATLATSFVIFGIGFIVSDRSVMRPLDREAIAVLARSDIFGITSATLIAIIVVDRQLVPALAHQLRSLRLRGRRQRRRGAVGGCACPLGHRCDLHAQRSCGGPGRCPCGPRAR